MFSYHFGSHRLSDKRAPFDLFISFPLRSAALILCVSNLWLTNSTAEAQARRDAGGGQMRSMSGQGFGDIIRSHSTADAHRNTMQRLDHVEAIHWHSLQKQADKGIGTWYERKRQDASLAVHQKGTLPSDGGLAEQTSEEKQPNRSQQRLSSTPTLENRKTAQTKATHADDSQTARQAAAVRGAWWARSKTQEQANEVVTTHNSPQKQAPRVIRESNHARSGGRATINRSLAQWEQKNFAEQHRGTSKHDQSVSSPWYTPKR